MTIALLLLVVLVAAPAAFAATITLTGIEGTSYIRAAAKASDLLLVTPQTAYPSSLPTAGSVAVSDGASSNTMTYTLSNASFNFTFDHIRGATYRSMAESIGGISFSPDTNVNYVLSGTYRSNDTDGLRTSMMASIYDYTANSLVFDDHQESHVTTGESFTLGQPGGDYYNAQSGSLTGTLIAGHQYQLVFQDLIQSDPVAATTSAHATGYLNLTFVPEPTTAALLGLGLTGVAAAGRKRRSAH